MMAKVPMTASYAKATGDKDDLTKTKVVGGKSTTATISGKKGVTKTMTVCPECGAHFSTSYE